MSTKSSLAYIEMEEKETFEFHIFLQMMDDCYYLETDCARIKLPESIAKGFAEVLKAQKGGKMQ